MKWLSHYPFHRQAIFICTVFHNGSKSAKVHFIKTQLLIAQDAGRIGGGERDGSHRSSLQFRFLKRSEYPRKPVTTPGV